MSEMARTQPLNAFMEQIVLKAAEVVWISDPRVSAILSRDNVIQWVRKTLVDLESRNYLLAPGDSVNVTIQLELAGSVYERIGELIFQLEYLGEFILKFTSAVYSSSPSKETGFRIVYTEEQLGNPVLGLPSSGSQSWQSRPGIVSVRTARMRLIDLE